MTLYDFVDSIWLGQVEFRDTTPFHRTVPLTRLPLSWALRISQITL